MEIISVFTETNKFVALFLDTNGEYLGVDYVTDNVPVGPDVTDLTKPGYKADPWGELAVINEHTIFFVNYTKTSSVKVTVNEVQYDLNDVVTLTSESPVLWLENGLPVWYGETYSFTALSNRTITTETGDEPRVLVSAVKGLDLRDDESVSHLGQVYVGDNQELIEVGFLLHTDDNMLLTLDTSDVVVLRSNSVNEFRNEFLRTVSSANSTYTNVRAYAVLEDGTVVYEQQIQLD